MKKVARPMLISLAAITVALAGDIAFAQGASGNLQTATPVRKQIIEEVIHDFVVLQYPSPVLVDSKTPDAAAGQPEAMFASWIHAMRSQRYADVIKYWDANAQNKLEQLDRQQGKKQGDWEDEWRRMLSGNQVLLTHRINYGSYVLFAFIVRANSGHIYMKDTVAMHLVSGVWKMTHDLSDSVVRMYWDSEQQRIQRLANPSYKRAGS